MVVGIVEIVYEDGTRHSFAEWDASLDGIEAYALAAKLESGIICAIRVRLPTPEEIMEN